ncbi:MAG: indolepyruvate oxidoreductase subunit beta [Lentisphaerota bacterium]
MTVKYKQDIVIAGVGGQGILTIAGVIGMAALKKGLHVKQSEVHGMAQRGGAVVSHLRFSEQHIASDLIPHAGASLLLSTEIMETLRYFPSLKKDAWVVANKHPLQNISNYPPLEPLIQAVESWPHHLLIDAEHLAREAGARRAVNIVMLGAASPFIHLPVEDLRAEVGKYFSGKGAEVVEKNLKAFDLGREFSSRFQVPGSKL